MRKVIAAINMTLDGFSIIRLWLPMKNCINTMPTCYMMPAPLSTGGTLSADGRLLAAVVNNPTGDRATDDLAVAIDAVPKVVFSRTLQKVPWESARVATRGIEEEVADLNQQPGNDIVAGSSSLIIALTQRGLIDEYQLCVHPVIAGSGLPLFKASRIGGCLPSERRNRLAPGLLQPRMI